MVTRFATSASVNSISRHQWSQFTDFDTVCARAGGRRRWNEERAARAKVRRRDVAALLLKYSRAMNLSRGRLVHWGIYSRIARDLGVHRSTICRDVKVITSFVPMGRWR
jgi:hypothetical protein